MVYFDLFVLYNYADFGFAAVDAISFGLGSFNID